MISALQGRAFDAERILENITDAFFALDTDWQFIYINNQAEALWGRPRADLLGRNVWTEFPEAVGSAFDRQFHQAAAQGAVMAFEEFYPPLNAWLEVRVYPSANDLSVFFQDVSERKQAEELLRHSGAQARAAQARLDVALAAGGIATWNWDLVTGRVALTALFSVTPEEAVARRAEDYLQAVHPGDRKRVKRAVLEAIRGCCDYETECRVVLAGGERSLILRGTVTEDAAGRPLACNGVLVDVTEQAERSRREKFLADLAARASRLSDPDEVIADALRSVGEYFGVARCVFVDIDIEADTCTTHPDYRVDPLVVSMTGVVSISSFGEMVVAAYGAGQAVVVDDVRNDPAQVPEWSVPTYDALDIRAHVGVPVVHSDRLVSCIGVHSAVPRRWKLEEVALLRTVVERIWLTVEVTRQERALVREAEATVRVLETITDGFHAVDRAWKFTYVNQQAEKMIFRKGQDLIGKDLWEEFPEAVGTVFEREYRRAVAEQVPISFESYYPPLDAWLDVRAFPSPVGLSVFFQNISDRRRAEAALRESEERLRLATEGGGVGIWRLVPATNALTWNRRCLEIFGLSPDSSAEVTGQQGWSLVHPEDLDGMKAAMDRTVRENTDFRYEYRVCTPSGETRWVQSLGKPHTDGTGEVAHVEGVLIDITPQRETTERLAAAYQRERHVAEELQAALTPPVPERVPGLALAKYYEAALDEAGVGGDFYDIFPMEKGHTALVVGDLSGKGLAAATQVATVRNMLRYAVLRSAVLAEAITELNRVLADQGLLTGFATLFVGVYDSGAGELTYVNCGQEPALVRRASGHIVPLDPTGPVLGSLPEAFYEEQVITLRLGDALAVFTDGLTEVGPTRTAMLGINGVASILAGAAAAEGSSAETISERVALSLISGVDAAARNGVMRDDMCLLVAAVE